ncbi:hypothetical protein E1A91_D10G119700v1 [Gossypium mustelinum]|uniref:Uncharacterized protein n=1 Tax=Gossypium mustelinum TaxID=34275 RepID=A0A5D2T7I5_GOSMU|nr:hypothetical protein E1A91_D10G119700v1 [Gossypium mustelinum]
MSYRFFFCKTFSIPFLRLASHFLLISFPPYFLSVHQHQPLLLIFGVLFLLGCVYYQQVQLMVHILPLFFHQMNKFLTLEEKVSRLRML